VTVRRAYLGRALWTAGSSGPIKIAMIAITTNPDFVFVFTRIFLPSSLQESIPNAKLTHHDNPLMLKNFCVRQTSASYPIG
jgi:hypothetical protein